MTSMITRLAPRPPDVGYTRVAVAQFHYNPAAVVSEASYLEQPFGIETIWAKVPAHRANFQDIARRRRELGIRLRALYLEQIAAKLTALAEHCAAWGCSLLVLPEYSVPPESLRSVMQASGAMTTVLGTHYVEAVRTRGTFYPDLGVTSLEPGHAIAIVSSGGSVIGSQLKMQRSKWEPDVRCATNWSPIQHAALGPLGPLGILICIDALNDRHDSFAQLVQPHLRDTALLAVPSHTPDGSRVEFEQALRTEASRHGRPVAYANYAGGGGTTVYIENANTGEAFPLGVPTLDSGCEGIVIVDVDLELNRPRDSRLTRMDHRPVARPIAAAQLIYRADQAGRDYYIALDEIVAATTLNPLVDALRSHSDRLHTAASSLGGPTVGRILDLVDKLDVVDDVERVLGRLRDVFMPNEVLSPVMLRNAMLDVADAETALWSGDREVYNFVAECRSQLQAARNEAL